MKEDNKKRKKNYLFHVQSILDKSVLIVKILKKIDFSNDYFMGFGSKK